MWSRRCVGSEAWNLHLLHLNLMSWFDVRFENLNLLSSLLCRWFFWTWSLISVGLSELNTHWLHLKFPNLNPVGEECLVWDFSFKEELYLICDLNFVSYWRKGSDLQAASLWALNCSWLKVENPQSSQRIGWASLSTEYLLFFWNKPWALLMCSRKRVFQVVL